MVFFVYLLCLDVLINCNYYLSPGRALLDRLTSTTVSEDEITSGATSGAASGLLPAPLDVAPYSAVMANASCGDAGAEEYCRDTPGK